MGCRQRAAWRWGIVLLLSLAARDLRAQEPPAPASAGDAGSCVGKARLRGLGFDSNGVALDGDDAVILDLVAEVIRDQCAGRVVVIEGHTDVWGEPDYNRSLSERRAETVKDALVERGIPAQQLRAVGLGEDHPLTSDPAREAQALNRRITLRAEPGGS
jgi:outer membrane protein OmpA-like peptidoglycan-associated protein